jgi:hypothetical protein
MTQEVVLSTASSHKHSSSSAKIPDSLVVTLDTHCEHKMRDQGADLIQVTSHIEAV